MIWDEPEDSEGHGLSGLTSVVVVVLVSAVIAFGVHSVLPAMAWRGGPLVSVFLITTTGGNETMNKQKDADLGGVITSILVLFCAVILLFGMYSILMAIA